MFLLASITIGTFLSSYIVVVLVFHRKWNQIVTPFYTEIAIETNEIIISVIVPFRNEANNILNLIDSIQNQSFSPKSYELILVDDYSTDQSLALIGDYISSRSSNIRLVKNTASQGKKNAISLAISIAKGEIIACTDADCIHSPHWLHTLYLHFQNQDKKLAFGPVVLSANTDLFEQMQQIEFASLVGSGAATWALQLPTMCNGANIAYRKLAFYEVNAFQGNENIPSGDDEFLMHKIFEKYPSGVDFLKNRNALVETKALKTWTQFKKQRLRWASKWEHYSVLHVQMIALYVFLANFFLIASFFILPFYICVLLWLSRAVVEYSFLSSVLRFMHKQLNLKAFASLLFVYPFYVVYFALAARFENKS